MVEAPTLLAWESKNFGTSLLTIVSFTYITLNGVYCWKFLFGFLQFLGISARDDYRVAKGNQFGCKLKAKAARSASDQNGVVF